MKRPFIRPQKDLADRACAPGARKAAARAPGWAVPASAAHAPDHSDQSDALRIRSRYSGALRKYHAQTRWNCGPRTPGRASSWLKRSASGIACLVRPYLQYAIRTATTRLGRTTCLKLRLTDGPASDAGWTLGDMLDSLLNHVHSTVGRIEFASRAT